jgi:hypothetical protein
MDGSILCVRAHTRHIVALTSLCTWMLALGCGGSDTSSEGAAEPTETVRPPVTPEPDGVVDVPPAPADVAPPAPGPVEPNEPNAPAPDDPEPIPAPRSCNDSLSFDDLYGLIDDDLRAEGDDGVTLRYISLSNRINQGICAEDLDTDRFALIKALNSLSTELGVAVPEAIDDAGILYRIDLGDYGWDQATSVDGVAFADKWEAIIAASPYAIEFEGDEADEAKLAAATTVPLLHADALIDVATVGNLYYALIGIGESEDALLEQLGINEDDDIVLRAGTTRSRLSRQDAVAERLEVGDLQGYYWARYDIAQEGVGESIFADPLGFQPDSIAAVFSLPNGFNGYALFDGAGVRVADTDVIGDQAQRDGRVRNSISCSQCHAAGLLPIEDEVRSYVEQNPLDFDADTFEDVQDEFVSQAEIDEVIDRDVGFYRAALARAGIDTVQPDPVNTVYVRFDGDVSLTVAAGDLGVTPSFFEDQLAFLSDQADPILSSLRGGNLRREQFDGAYLAALCALNVSSGNRPLAADCAAVGQ